jgi:hypothetical protein
VRVSRCQGSAAECGVRSTAAATASPESGCSRQPALREPRPQRAAQAAGPRARRRALDAVGTARPSNRMQRGWPPRPPRPSSANAHAAPRCRRRLAHGTGPRKVTPSIVPAEDVRSRPGGAPQHRLSGQHSRFEGSALGWDEKPAWCFDYAPLARRYAQHERETVRKQSPTSCLSLALRQALRAWQRRKPARCFDYAPRRYAQHERNLVETESDALHPHAATPARASPRPPAHAARATARASPPPRGRAGAHAGTGGACARGTRP